MANPAIANAIVANAVVVNPAMASSVPLPRPQSGDGQLGLASWYTAGRSDGFGDRLLMFDNSGAASLELLRFRPDLAVEPGFEDLLRQRVQRLFTFKHPAFATLRAVEHLEGGEGLALVSNHIAGRRLAELLDGRAESSGLHPAFVSWLVQQITPLVAALQNHGYDIVHGALTIDRIILTPEGRIAIVEHALGSAVRALEMSPNRLWREFGIIARPTSRGEACLDARGDIMQLGVVALSLLVGRRLTLAEVQDHLPGLLDEFADLPSARTSLFTAPLRQWLERALQLHPQAYRSATEAQDGLRELPEQASSSLPTLLMSMMAGTTALSAEPRPALAALPHSTDAIRSDATPAVQESADLAAPDTQAAPGIHAVVSAVEPVADAADVVSVVNRVPDEVEATVNEAGAVASPALGTTSHIAEQPALASAVTDAPTNDDVHIDDAHIAAALDTTLDATVDGNAGARLTPPLKIVDVPPREPEPASPAADSVHTAPILVVDHVIDVAGRVAAIDTAHGETPLSDHLHDYHPATTAHEADSNIAATPGTPSPASPLSVEPIGGSPAIAQSSPSSVVDLATVLPPPAADLDVPVSRSLEVAAVTSEARPTPYAFSSITDPAANPATNPMTRWLIVGLATLAVIEAGVIAMMASRNTTTSSAAAVTAPLDVTVDTARPGVQVFVDDQPAGTTPLKLSLSSGTRAIRIADAPAGSAAPAAVPAVTPAQADAAAVRQRTGNIRFSSPVPLQVLEGTRVLGSSTEGTIVIPPGTHQLDLVNEELGFRTRQSVTVRPGESATYTVTTPMGRLSVNAQPWAQVWVDQMSVGETPIANLSVAIGQHEVTFRHPQLGERKRTVTVRADGVTRLSTTFEP